MYWYSSWYIIGNMSIKSVSSPWLFPRIRDVLFISIFISVLMMGQRMLNLDGDLPRHLLLGEYIFEHRIIPTTELFIYPYLGQVFVPHEWLTNVILHILYSKWQLAGVILFSALLLSSTFTILYDRVSKTSDLRLPTLVLVAWGAGATSVNWAARPHIVSMFLLVIWLIWVDDLRRNENLKIWRFPVLMLIWSNLHGEFIAGILVLIAYAAGWTLDYVIDRPNANLRIGKKTWLALILSIFASLANPGGIGPWVVILGFQNNQYLISHIAETNPPIIQNADLHVFWGLLIMSIFLLGIKKVNIPTGKVFLLTGFSLMGLAAIRNIHLYGIVAPFVLSETLVETRNVPLLAKLESGIRTVETRINGIFWITLSTIVLVSIVLLDNTFRGWYQFKEPTFPIQAVEWLKGNPQQGNMFNDLNWGGYISLQLWPAQRPFIDSLADTTGDVTRKYETVITLSDGWEEIIQMYDIAQIIVPTQSALARELISQGWKIVYQDEVAIILVAP